MSLTRLWRWLTDDHVVLTDPAVERYFARCTACGRVWMHYWACVTAEDRRRGRRVGCPCGNLRCRIVVLPEWQAAWYVLSRWLWRRVLRRERYWDPRLPARRGWHGGWHG
jgi:hypothetical protein